MFPLPWHMCIVIPARNEAELLPRCLHSILNAANRLPNFCSFDIVVMIDSSNDDSFSIAKKILQTKGFVEKVQLGNVGSVRKQGCQIALARSRVSSDFCWLANTDADTQIPSDWLLHYLAHAMNGAHGVTGIVEIDSFQEHSEKVPERFKTSYIINADGTHPHIHGANVGIRADYYQRAGGWQKLANHEDHALWKDLKKLSANLVADTSLLVTTSGRKVGRVPNGFAAALAKHNW